MISLAVRELRRSAGRFTLPAGSIGLLVFLILFQQALQDGLIQSFVGAIENQSAPVIVYPVDARRTLQGGVVTPELETTLAEVDGLGAIGRIGQGTFSVRTESGGDSVSLVAFDDPDLGAPTTMTFGRLPSAAGEVVALDSAGPGYEIGDRIVVRPGDSQLTVVGRASSIGLQAAPTLFATFETYSGVVIAANPDATGVLPNALAVRPAAGVSNAELVARINAASPDADALTRDDAARLTPGVAQVRQSFSLIFVLFGVVVPLVTGLFFLISTLQKAGALTLLRAIGVPAARLVGSLFVQVAVVLGLGLGIGLALYTPVSSLTIGDIPLSFQTDAVLAWSALLAVCGLASALVSARRVLAIDPIDATNGWTVG